MEPRIMQMCIAVIGGSECDDETYKLAEEVGRGLAREGATLICGGLTGVMAAACRGARAEGGITVGILPGDDRESGNADVMIPIVTGMGYARNALVVKSAQVAIAIDGSYGTLSEIAYAMQFYVPVIGLNTWDLSQHGDGNNPIVVVHSADQAVQKAISIAKKGSRRKSGKHS